MSIARIRKNDTVVKINGVDAGKTGKVLFIGKTGDRALVEGVNLVKKTLKKSEDNPQGGIIDKEASIEMSNLMLYCPECKKGVRIKRRRDGSRSLRVCAAAGCNHAFDE